MVILPDQSVRVTSCEPGCRPGFNSWVVVLSLHECSVVLLNKHTEDLGISASISLPNFRMFIELDN